VIRKATLDDIPAIADLGERFFRQSHYAQFATWDRVSFAETLAVLVRAGTLLVVQHECVVGMGAFLLFPWYFNASQHGAQEIFLFIAPDHRGRDGFRLIEEMERAAKEAGAVAFIAGSTEGMRHEALDRLYLRRGYAPAGNTFIKRF